jgi:hypothetical protein
MGQPLMMTSEIVSPSIYSLVIEHSEVGEQILSIALAEHGLDGFLRRLCGGLHIQALEQFQDVALIHPQPRLEQSPTARVLHTLCTKIMIEDQGCGWMIKVKVKYRIG